MKKGKTTMKLFATVITLVTAVAIWFAWGARRTQAIQDSEEFPSPIGIAAGQTARLRRSSAAPIAGSSSIGGFSTVRVASLRNRWSVNSFLSIVKTPSLFIFLYLQACSVNS